LIADSHVVHIGVADGVLVAEGVVADSYALVAFDVGAECAGTYGSVEGACGVATKRLRTNSRIVARGSVGYKGTAPNSSVV